MRSLLAPQRVGRVNATNPRLRLYLPATIKSRQLLGALLSTPAPVRTQQNAEPLLSAWRARSGRRRPEDGSGSSGATRLHGRGQAHQRDLLHPRGQLRPQALEPTGACSAGRVRVLSIDGGRSPRPCWSGSSTAAGAGREPRGPRHGLLRHGGRVRRQRVLGGRAVRSTKE